MTKFRNLFCAVGLLLVAFGAMAQDGNTSATENNLFVVRYEPGLQPLEINRMHSWVVHVEKTDGTPVEDAAVTVIGGMPDHDHGLPTLPQTTRYLGDGDYLVEGMKFHMNGRWLITVAIVAGSGSDEVTFEMRL